VFYIYFLCSCTDPTKNYVGFTKDLRARLSQHNRGECPYNSRFILWKVVAYVAVEDERTETLF